MSKRTSRRWRRRYERQRETSALPDFVGGFVRKLSGGMLVGVSPLAPPLVPQVFPHFWIPKKLVMEGVLRDSKGMTGGKIEWGVYISEKDRCPTDFRKTQGRPFPLPHQLSAR